MLIKHVRPRSYMCLETPYCKPLNFRKLVGKLAILVERPRLNLGLGVRAPSPSLRL
jgi:hypothetical protein